jgi:two-component system C4-dicarboxylate transport sensor histidine kinase DctB
MGQMSAPLSHELNQPLAAVKACANNARAFLKRN